MATIAPSHNPQDPASRPDQKSGDEPVVDSGTTVSSKPSVPLPYFEGEKVTELLWDTEDENWLKKVHCKAEIRVLNIDQNLGTFSGSMRCIFSVRTPKPENADDAKPPDFLVPDVRMPALSTSLSEKGRSFKQDVGEHSILWKGICTYNFSGSEVLELRDFPYDRQLINLGLLHFVWRCEDEAKGFEGMSVVYAIVKTVSRIPEFDVFRACLTAKNMKRIDSGPTKASRFELSLRLQRQPNYYIVNIFSVISGITVMSACGLLVDPASLNGRLSLYAAGLLTIVTFKFSINESLPHVGYLTLADRFMLLQMFTHILLSAEAATVSALLDKDAINKEDLKLAESIASGVLMLMLLMILLYFSYRRGRTDWKQIIVGQEGDAKELQN